MSGYDVIVAGLGAMGGAAASVLARRGRRVLGLDRFAPPHREGSSSGRTRIIREAYFEHPAYVPIVQRAYEAWAALERDSGRTLFRQTGGLMIGPPDGVLVGGALRSAREHALRHEIVPSEDLARRWPALRPDVGVVGVWEPRAGVLFPEECVAAHLELAARTGAELRTGEPVLSWEADGEGVAVRTSRETYRAERLVLAPGAWLMRLLPDLSLPLTVRRQLAFWFEPIATGAFAPERLPVFIWEHEPRRYFYGFPDFGDGVKVARHGEGEIVEAEHAHRAVARGEEEDLRLQLARYLPAACGPLRETAVCLYTCTPDGHFIVDSHPAHPQVTIASVCSGHGFKFASAMGEILADLATGERPRFDLSMFRIARFAAGRSKTGG